MLINASDLSDATTANTRICILGSGAAGITLACELDACGHKVLLIEAGGFKATAETRNYYDGVADPPHTPATEYRRVQFGGTTSIWGGRCVPFDPIDFEARDYVANSGWPITYDEVAGYYPRALEYCDAGNFDFTASGSIDRAKPIISGLVPDGVIEQNLIERYSPPTRFGKFYRAKLRDSKNVTVVLNARCVRLAKAVGEDRIESVEIALRAGERRKISADIFIVALGGIETPRMLLASDPTGVGFGNRTDRLGRFYSCHLGSVLGKLVPQEGAAVQFYFEKTRDGIYCRRKFQFTASAQRDHRLLNSAFRLHFPEYSDAAHGNSVMSTIYLAKSILIPEYRKILQHNAGASAVNSPALEHWRNVVSGLPELAKFGYEWLFHYKLATREMPYTLVANADGSYPLEFNCEQTPLESSRITLLQDKDAHGVPRVHIGWRRSDDDIVASQRAFAVLREALGRQGVARLEFDHNGLSEQLAAAAPVASHHMGTTRMAATPRLGVVDRDCAIFDLPNVYVAGSALFPTGSHANPTLTIVALALRLVDHLRSQLAA
jgi:choline dehydrogenase-like flavoprotein